MIHPLTSWKKRTREFLYLDPERDWLILLIAAAVILVGIVLWNVWVFETVASGGVIGAPVVTPLPTLSQSSLETIRTIFANRSTEQTKYLDGTYTYTDPSGTSGATTSTLGAKGNLR